MSSGIHLSAILQEIPQPSVTEIGLKITYLKFCWNLPGANELRSQGISSHGNDFILLGYSVLCARRVNSLAPDKLEWSFRYI